MSGPTAPQETPASDLKALWTRCALFVAVVGVLGSLHLSLAMNLKACPLCFYQRAFIMATAGVLAFGTFLPGMPTAALTVLSLVPAFAGGYIAAQHTRMVVTGDMECPEGITGVLAAPAESLVVYVLIVGLLIGDLLHRKQFVMQGVGAILLGLVFGITCIRGVHPGPQVPRPDPLDTCWKVPPKE
jgi:disulfide bond formation protein DsbB